MADDDVLVSISGPALSLLLYENTRYGDIIGFFLGEVRVYISKKVTDAERDIQHTKRHINIKTVLTAPPDPFYNSVAEIDEEKLQLFLRENQKEVVGWYHYRRDEGLNASYRDKLLHSEFSKYFCNINDLLVQENFIFGLLTTSESEVGGTHKFKYCLLNKRNEEFKPISLKIDNLGTNSSRVDGSDYKLSPNESSVKSDAFDKIYASLRGKLDRTTGVESVNLIQKAAEHLLEKLLPEVARTDKLVSELEREFIILRSKLIYQAYEKAKLEHEMREMQLDAETSTEAVTELEPLQPSLLALIKNTETGGAADSKLLDQTNLKEESNVKRVREWEKALSTSEIGKANISTIKQLETSKLLDNDSKSTSDTIETKTQKSKKQPIHEFIESSVRNNCSDIQVFKSPNHDTTDP